MRRRRKSAVCHPASTWEVYARDCRAVREAQRDGHLFSRLKGSPALRRPCPELARKADTFARAMSGVLDSESPATYDNRGFCSYIGISGGLLKFLYKDFLIQSFPLPGDLVSPEAKISPLLPDELAGGGGREIPAFFSRSPATSCRRKRRSPRSCQTSWQEAGCLIQEFPAEKTRALTFPFLLCTICPLCSRYWFLCRLTAWPAMNCNE